MDKAKLVIQSRTCIDCHTFFGALAAIGLLASIYYIQHGFLLGVLDFNIVKALHINALLIIGMVAALLVSGMAQSFYERALGGSTLDAFMAAQANPWFVQGMIARVGFGVMFAVGYLVLVYDLLMLGRRRVAVQPVPKTA